jgi:hypothetical protein
MSSSSSIPVAEFSMEMEKRLKAAQTISEQRIMDSRKDLKKDLQAAQIISEQRIVEFEKQQLYKAALLGAGMGFIFFNIFEIGMSFFGYGITKLG